MAKAMELAGNPLGGCEQKTQEALTGSRRCSRCAGLMVLEESFHTTVGATRAEFLVRRCVQCGEVIDPMILQHRRLQRGHDAGELGR